MDKVKHYIKDEGVKSLIKKTVDKLKNKKINKEKSNEYISSLIERKDAKSVDELIKENNSNYDLDTLLNAVIQIGEPLYIYNSALFAKNITKKQFLLCAQAMINSRDADGVVYFYINCYKNNGSSNSFNVSSEVIKMIKETNDREFINAIIKNINKREDVSRRYSRVGIPYGEGLFEGMTWLRYCLQRYIEKTKKAGV